MPQAQLKNAPSFDQKQWPDLQDKHWGDAVHAYYGQPSYGKPLPPKSAGDDTVAPVPHRLLRPAQVLQKAVINPRGQRLGEIAEVVIDASAGHVAYAVLSAGAFLGLGEKLFAMPWGTLQQSAGLGTFQLDIDKDALHKAPGFDKNHWPDMADPHWGTAIHSYYKQQPYWQEPPPEATPPQEQHGAPATGRRP
jgi:hypothetical protein